MQSMQKRTKNEIERQLERETRTKKTYEGVIVAEGLIIAIMALMAILLFVKLREQENYCQTTALAAEADTEADAGATTEVATPGEAVPERRFSTPIHLTLSGPDFLIDREGRIGYADLEKELAAYGAENLVFDRNSVQDEDGETIEVGTLAGVFPNAKGDTEFEIKTDLRPPQADEHDYSLTTTIVLKDENYCCFTATRERMAMFEEFEPSEDVDSGLFPTVLFYDEAKGIMLTEEQVNALKWAAANFLPDEDEVEDVFKTSGQITDPYTIVNLPAISDYLVKRDKVKP